MSEMRIMLDDWDGETRVGPVFFENEKEARDDLTKIVHGWNTDDPEAAGFVSLPDPLAPLDYEYKRCYEGMLDGLLNGSPLFVNIDYR